jgi:hypothetical protein
MKTRIYSLSCYRKIFFKINSIFTFYSKIIFAFPHPFILSALKPLSVTEFILLYYITNINFTAIDNLNSQRLYTKFSTSNLTQGLICVISNYLNSTTFVLTVLRSLTTAYKCMLPFSERLIWSDDFKIFGLNTPPLMQNPLWNKSEPCTAIQSVLNSFPMFSFFHRMCFNDNITYTTPTKRITTIYSHSRTCTWQWRWCEIMQSCYYKGTVEKHPSDTLLWIKWQLQREETQTLLAPRNFCFNYVKVKMIRCIVSSVYDHNFN